MQLTDSGAGRIKAYLSLAFILLVIFCGIKIVPVYVANYEFSDFIRNLAVNATVAYPPATVEGVTKQIMDEAGSLNLPVDPQNIQVTVGHTVTIKVDYSVPIDFKFYTWTPHFTTATENKQI
jgi:hypothetical protein